MESETRVRDMMKDDYETIRLGATIHEAVEKLTDLDRKSKEHGIPGAQSLLVIDEEGTLAGIITMFDILRGIEPPFLRESEHLAAITWDGLFGELVQQAENKTVEDAMTPGREVISVSPDDRLMKVVELMVKNGFSRLPVLEEGKVVGMVRLYDVFHEVGREMLRQGGDQNQ